MSSAGTQESRPRRRRARRLLRLAAIVALAGSAAAVVLAVVLLRLPAGARFVVERLERVLPGELTVGQVAGNAGHRLELREVRYRPPPVAGEPGWELSARRLELEWSALALLRRGVSIHSLLLYDVELRLPAAAAPRDPSPLPELRLPLRVRVDQAEILGLRVVRADGAPLLIEHVRLERVRAAPAGGPVRFRELSIAAERWRATAGGELRPVGSYPLELEASWAAALDLAEGPNGDPQRFWLEGEGSLRGDAARLELRHAVTAAAADDAGAPRGSAAATAAATATATATPPVALRGQLSGFLRDPLQDLRAEELTLTWDRLRWPPLGATLLASDRGSVVATGSLDDLTLRVDASVEVPRVPVSEWRADGRLVELERLEVASVRGELLGGTVAGSAEVRLAAPASWSAKLRATGIDPGRLAQDWPGRVDFELAANGRSTDGGESLLALTIDELGGELRGYPVGGTARVDIEGERIEVRGLEARSGEARLSASGRLGPDFALDWRLDAPDLRALHPDAAGSLRASGQLTGTRDRPELALAFAGEELRWQERRAARATGRARVGWWSGGPAEVAIDAFDVRAPEAGAFGDIARLTLSVDGTRDDHEIALDARGPAGALALSASGALAGMGSEPPAPVRWSGDVARLRVELLPAALPEGDDRVAAALLQMGTWELMAPGARVALGQDGALLQAGDGSSDRAEAAPPGDAACFAHLDPDGSSGARLCVGGTFDRHQPWRLEGVFAELPLAWLEPWLPADAREVRGAVSGASLVAGVGTTIERAELRLDETEVTVRYARADTPQDSTELEVTSLVGRAQLDGDGLAALVVARLGDGGDVALDLRLPGYAFGSDRPRSEQPVRGQIDATVPELAPWASWLPGLELDSGRLEAHLQLAGTIGSPDVEGRLEARDIRGRYGGIVLADGADPLELSFSTPEIVARTTAGGAAIEGRLLFDDPPGSLEVAVELPGFSALGGRPLVEQPIAGTATIALESLDTLASLVPALQEPRGRLEARWQLGGTLGATEVAGTTELSDFEAEVPAYGLELRGGRLRADGRLGERLALSGEVRSGDGTLAIEGGVRAVAGDFAADLSLRGSGLTVSNTPEVRLRADVDLALRAQEGAVAVEGEVTFPWARIDLRELPPDAAQTSPDVVVVGRAVEGPAAEVAEVGPLAVTGRVRVRFGDDFRFRGFGFETEPRGTLLVTVPARGPTTATGQLRLDEGVYRAYGQNLQIEDGRVIFGGGPITNPGLDVTAYRTVGTVRAGVEIGGTLERPVLDLIADQPMSETEILHYVVLGRAPGQTSSPEEGDLLARAAAALSLRAGNRIARNLATRYGFDELRLEGGLDDASLVVGRFLSPRFYLSYGIGLFDSISTFTVRYVLTKHLTLVADTGRGTGATVEYTVEMGKRKEGSGQ